MTQAVVAYEREGGVGRLVLSQPDRMNAVTFEMWESLPDLIARAEADEAVRVIVVEGAGSRAFSAGADISQFGDRRSAGGAALAYEAAVSGAMMALSNAQKPTIARISGLAFGGGLALAMCCDIRLAAHDARFRIPAARLGIGYAFAAVEAFVARIGVSAAAEILLSARIVDGGEAERLGLLSKAWPPGSFEAEAQAYVVAVAGNAPLTLRALKSALNECLKPAAQRDRAGVDQLVHACMHSADYIEGQAAFREKREPRFTGA